MFLSLEKKNPYVLFELKKKLKYINTFSNKLKSKYVKIYIFKIYTINIYIYVCVCVSFLKKKNPKII